MNDGDILITQDDTGNPVGFDLVKMETVDLEDVLHPGGDAHMVQLDDTHFMWCTLFSLQRNRSAGPCPCL